MALTEEKKNYVGIWMLLETNPTVLGENEKSIVEQMRELKNKKEIKDLEEEIKKRNEKNTQKEKNINNEIKKENQK